MQKCYGKLKGCKLIILIITKKKKTTKTRNKTPQSASQYSCEKEYDCIFLTVFLFGIFNVYFYINILFIFLYIKIHRDNNSHINDTKNEVTCTPGKDYGAWQLVEQVQLSHSLRR